MYIEENSAIASRPRNLDRTAKLNQIAMSEDAPTLNLRIRNGASEYYNKVLVITPLGLSGSDRGVEDGNVYMGTLKHSMPDINGKFTVLNDFVLPPFQLP